MKIIPERDVYRLVIKSHLPEAERFEEWVVGEILPSIRKHGAYATENTIEQNEPPAPDPVPVPEGFKLFESEEFGQVRVVQGQDGEPWFVAKDVAEVLGYSAPRHAIKRFCKGGPLMLQADL